MTTVDQAKAMAKRLRAALAARDLAVPHATALQLVAAGLGHDDWNTACAALDRPAGIGPRFLEAVPILRIFDEAKAREFYCDFLGFEAQVAARSSLATATSAPEILRRTASTCSRVTGTVRW